MNIYDYDVTKKICISRLQDREALARRFVVVVAVDDARLAKLTESSTLSSRRNHHLSKASCDASLYYSFYLVRVCC